MSLADIRKEALKSSKHLLQKWLPEGKITGDEFVAGNPNREDKNPTSFKINIVTGKWSDFAVLDTDSEGGDIVSYYQYIKGGVDVKEAERAIRKDIKVIGRLGNTDISAAIKVERKPKGVSAQLPDDIKFPELIRDCEPVAASWPYHAASGDIVFYVAKLINVDGKKEVLPATLNHNGVVSLGLPYFEGGTPLYNRHLFKSGMRVVFGEGEKVADHLQSLYPNHIAITSQGGSSALFKSDLQPLWEASEIIIFQDADEPGKKYAMQLGIISLLKNIATLILDVHALGWSDGQDVADFHDLGDLDYEGHIQPFSEWFSKQPDILKCAAVVSALAGVSVNEYEMLRKPAAEEFEIRVSFLDKEVAKIRPHTEVKEEEVEPDLTPEEIAERRAVLWLEIKHIAELPNILEEVVNVCHDSLNVVGEGQLIELLYMGIVSRLLKAMGDCPVSIFCKGSSSGGKSYVMGIVLSLFREIDTWIQFGSMSQKAMIYDQDTDYRRKILFFPEINQFMQDQDSDLTMMVKTILSEHKLNHRVVETDPITGERRTVNIYKEGPIGLFAGTTRDFTDAEIETRVTSVYVNESLDHTKAILKGVAQSKASPISISDPAILDVWDIWHKFDEWLAMHPTHMVAIPYFPAIVEALGNMPVRFRRDIPHGLSGLIKASALIHCATREQSDEGYVIANMADYEYARAAIEPSLSLAANPGETPACAMVLNWIIKNINALSSKDKGVLKVASRDIARDLGVNQSTVSRHIGSLIKSNQLKNKEVNKGKPYQLLLGPETSHESSHVLPTREQVFGSG